MRRSILLALCFVGMTNYAQNVDDEFSKLTPKENFTNAAKIKAAFKSKGLAEQIRSIFLDDRGPDTRNNFSPEGSFTVGTMEEAPDGSKGAVVFVVGKYDLDNTSKVVLSNFASLVLEAAPEVNITVSGHTDSTGTEQFNYTLSVNRALEVKKFLISKGLKASQIQAMGFGEQQPLYSNETSNGRAMNRRVEFDFY